MKFDNSAFALWKVIQDSDVGQESHQLIDNARSFITFCVVGFSRFWFLQNLFRSEFVDDPTKQLFVLNHFGNRIKLRIAIHRQRINLVSAQACGNIQSGVFAAQSDQQLGVSIGFESYDPLVAQEIVTAIVEEYRKQHTRTHRSQGGTEFLKTETEEVRAKLFESEKKFEEFKNRTQMISVDDQRKVMVERVAKLKNELLDTEALKSAAESEIRARKDLSEKMDQSQRLSKTEGAGNEGIDGMRQELFRLQVKYEEALSRYSPEHPTAKHIEEQLAAAQKRFDLAESKMVEVVEGPNKLYEGAIMEIMLKEPTLVALKSKSAALQMQLDEVVSKLDAFNANETEFIRLKREVEICDENFKRHARILQQASMDSSMQENDLSNLSIFQPASLNLKPYRPSKMVNLLAGLMAGFVGGCSLAVLLGFREACSVHGGSTGLANRTSNLEFESFLDLPVIATIPRQPRRLFSNSGI